MYVTIVNIFVLTHRGRVTHIYAGKLTIIVSYNGLPPGRRQAIIWTNAGILLIRTLGIKFSEILSEIHTFSSREMHLKMSSAKLRPFCFDLNVLSLSQRTGAVFTDNEDLRPRKTEMFIWNHYAMVSLFYGVSFLTPCVMVPQANLSLLLLIYL